MSGVLVEQQFNCFVKEFGGTVLGEHVGKSPCFSNADYYFEKYNIVAELKTLTQDKSDDPRVQTKLNRLLELWIKDGLIPDPGYGTFKLSTKDLPRQCQDEIYKVFQKPIHRRIDKANKQIRQTKKHLSYPSAKGLLLLVNEGNYALEIDALAHAVDKILDNGFSSIDNVLIFTVNLAAFMHGLDRKVLVWLPCYRKGYEGIDREIFDLMQIGWTKHLEGIVGENIPKIGPMPTEQLSNIRYFRR
ncbi:hypothetical protein [Cerasicoccus maritimus]|uniref:hypothetical protein n=1 Tax=Cerasicoccus maritimus TaxID=490089 RepID=UPI0028527290|nr:hypothetical protein [Cerasicoccus maritimus]